MANRLTHAQKKTSANSAGAAHKWMEIRAAGRAISVGSACHLCSPSAEWQLEHARSGRSPLCRVCANKTGWAGFAGNWHDQSWCSAAWPEIASRNPSSVCLRNHDCHDPRPSSKPECLPTYYSIYDNRQAARTVEASCKFSHLHCFLGPFPRSPLAPSPLCPASFPSG